jgi:hypothetical protein
MNGKRPKKKQRGGMKNTNCDKQDARKRHLQRHVALPTRVFRTTVNMERKRERGREERSLLKCVSKRNERKDKILHA